MSAQVYIDLQIASISKQLPALAEIQQWATAAVGERRDEAEISVRIVDTEEGADLNEHWRNKTGPTNVLSFPSDLPPELELPLLGDLVICAPVVERESEQQGKGLKAHWAHMVVHGTLHLLGYDHIEDQQADIMESLETQIMATLGFPDPYRDDD